MESWILSMQCSDADVFFKASKFHKSITLPIPITQCQNPGGFSRLNQVHDIWNLVAKTSAWEYCIDWPENYSFEMTASIFKKSSRNFVLCAFLTWSSSKIFYILEHGYIDQKDICISELMVFARE